MVAVGDTLWRFLGCSVDLWVSGVCSRAQADQKWQDALAEWQEIAWCLIWETSRVVIWGLCDFLHMLLHTSRHWCQKDSDGICFERVSQGLGLLWFLCLLLCPGGHEWHEVAAGGDRGGRLSGLFTLHAGVLCFACTYPTRTRTHMHVHARAQMLSLI